MSRLVASSILPQLLQVLEGDLNGDKQWESYCNATKTFEHSGEKQISLLKVSFPPTAVNVVNVIVEGSMHEDYAFVYGVVFY